MGRLSLGNIAPTTFLAMGRSPIASMIEDGSAYAVLTVTATAAVW